MRPACTDGVTVAHGYLFWGPWMCACDQTQIGAISLGSAGPVASLRKDAEASRLEVVAGLDKAVAPGDDFDEYANGGWRKNAQIPDDRSSTGVFLEVFQKEKVDPRAGLPVRNEIAAWAGALGVGDFDL